MPNKQLKHLNIDKRAISPLIIALIIIVVVGSIIMAIFVLRLGPFAWPRIVGSGNLITKNFDFSDFTTVKVESGFEVETIQSGSYNINITADDNMFDYIEVFKSGEMLTIRMKWGYSYESAKAKGRPTIITMPTLYKLEFSGGTHGTVEGFISTHEIVLDLSGGSRLTSDFNTTNDARFTLSGGSRLSMDGSANNLLISASGGSHLELSRFRIHNATVNLSGGSEATVNFDGSLDGDLSGGSHLKYIGDTNMVDVKTSGGSTVNEKP